MNQPPDALSSEVSRPSLEDEPLIEPQAMLDASERRLRKGRTDGASAPWVRLVLMSAALVAILVFHAALTDGVTGCFHRVADTSESIKVGDRPVVAPEIQIRRVPASDAVR